MRRAVAFLHDGWARGRVAFVVVAVVILGRVSVQQGRWLWPKINRSDGFGSDHFAIVMLGTPTRGTSLTVIWNKRYSIWKASRFQRASGPVVLTE